MRHKVIISGGGTGGHVFPAIAIANALRRIEPEIEILFVGANGRMEMERVPEAGYEIIGLDIQGIDRNSLWKNLALPFKLIGSLIKARKIIREFGADVAVGVGGFASGPLLMAANDRGLPTLIQEQNSYAGVTNKSLGKKAKKICVAYEGMDKFFPAEKIILTGNPIRRDSVAIEGKREFALQIFGLQPHKKTILIVGGSLGAKQMNGYVLDVIHELGERDDVQFIWQTGKTYYEDMERMLKLDQLIPGNVKVFPFLERMDLAYAAADLIISRAGAGTISELCVVGKPVILIPSPNVAEDHQTKNAQALVAKNAAVMISEADARGTMMYVALELLADEAKCASLSTEIKKMAMPDADEAIAREVLKLIK
ncbi:undecaprenyldiphospho-muramoylpentapeptide beta-N-acetylglucosaminyltransferase [Sphingobacterium chuzhouense]|uniref:UDP-N-acetylglucosamine--N-acetylmuramyl-(pentapeptide) pyrophosphoryl-undecaprenol N-acetylglucosamine transferase n=1 Tax=Sphingobacterium chuzhouense TaxID=1742264 RepID=A0ABR7XMM9_9SPHI|nr:undecaprenyldiphospho-muramoylpentapeptide beta-N-acetylglucosaminyltransferase [Sphingobacterium chuzhouense]MBD1420097.1 undecaprenyldiphospho-muramoylpentapeptide beta-N-acetylglucosaminyltransferase [Sphingobacterium chuzhouense]